MANHVTARHVISGSVACDPRDPGNPHSERYNFISWSAWRSAGGWDARDDWTCQPIPAHPFAF
jgi:hypothetical protein